jgi:hypothetical protein
MREGKQKAMKTFPKTCFWVHHNIDLMKVFHNYYSSIKFVSNNSSQLGLDVSLFIQNSPPQCCFFNRIHMTSQRLWCHTLEKSNFGNLQVTGNDKQKKLDISSTYYVDQVSLSKQICQPNIYNVLAGYK